MVEEPGALAEVIPFVPRDLSAKTLLSRLRNSSRVELVGAFDRSAFFNPPSEEYLEGSLLQPTYPYCANLYVAPNEPVRDEAGVSDLNTYLVRLLGEPLNCHELALMRFEDVDPVIFQLYEGGMLLRRSTELTYAIDISREAIAARLAGQMVIVPGTLVYEREIGKIIARQDFEFSFSGVGVNRSLHSGPEVCTTPLIGCLELHIFPSVGTARLAVRDDVSFLCSSIIPVSDIKE